MISISNRRHALLKILSILALLTLVTAVYSPGLSGPFILDDFSNFVDKPAVHMDNLSPDALAEAATSYGSRLPHRPISTVSLAFDYWFWGEEPFGYKMTNIGLHLATTILVLLLAWQVLRLSFEDHCASGGVFWWALAVAALWALHPIQVSTVLYVVQRMEMLAAFFIVLSLVAYIGGRRCLTSGAPGGWIRIALAALCTILAVLSKETGVLAPFFMLALELLLFRFAMARPQSAWMLKLGFGAIVTAALLLYLFWLVPDFVLGDRFVNREFTWDERLLTQLRVLPMYLGWMLLPAIDQYLFYYDFFPHSESLLQPITTLFGGFLLMALLAVALLLRRRAPLVSLGIIWFFVAHALTSNLFSLELVFEHRNYFALFAVLLSVVGSIALIRVKPERVSLAVSISLALVLGFAVITAIRAATWGDRMNLALYHVNINPQSERAGLDLVRRYLGRADLEKGLPFLSQARSQMERIAKLPNARTIADRALIVLAARLDESVPHEHWQRLLEKVRTRALNHDDFDAIYDLVEQRYEGAELSDFYLWELHNALCRREDVPAEIHVRFGYYAATVLGDMEAATSAFRRALTLRSEMPEREKQLRAAIEEAGIELLPQIEPCRIIDYSGVDVQGR